MRIAVVLVACATGMGCTVGLIDDPSNGSSNGSSNDELDEAALERLETYQRAMAKLNARPYKSNLGAFNINCYVAGDVADYQKVHPEKAGTNVTVAPGTVIVREVLDAQGQIAKLTIMAKGPPGYDPSLGDWWFGVTDPRGVPLTENGVVQLGRLTQCHNCHLDRAHDDFLFGVPSGT